MTEPKFLMSPWSFEGDSLYGKEHGFTVELAECFFPDENEFSAEQKNLIAAAPEMYQALKEIRDMLWSRPDISERLRPLMGFAEEAINQKAAAAIAKAEGGEA